MTTLKNFTLGVVAVLFSMGAVQAQDDEGGDMHKKAEAGDISVGFNYDLTPNINFTGLFGGGGAAPSAGNQFRNDAFGNAQIFGRYYLSSDMAVRVGLGISSISNTSISKDSTDWMESVTDDDGNVVGASSDSISFSESTTNTSQFNFSIMPGIEKHISTSSNIDPYVGAQIPIAILGKTKTDSTIERTGANRAAEEAVSYTYSQNTTQPGGFAWGIQGIVGFNWFLDDKVAIGMEYKLGFMNVSTGGEVTGSGESEIDGTNDSNTSDREIWNHQTETSNGGLSTMSNGGINVSIFF